MNVLTTVTHDALAQFSVHPDRCPLSRPEALLRLREAEYAIHDDLRVRLHATRLPLRMDAT